MTLSHAFRARSGGGGEYHQHERRLKAARRLESSWKSREQVFYGNLLRVLCTERSVPINTNSRRSVSLRKRIDATDITRGRVRVEKFAGKVFARIGFECDSWIAEHYCRDSAHRFLFGTDNRIRFLGGGRKRSSEMAEFRESPCNQATRIRRSYSWTCG